MFTLQGAASIAISALVLFFILWIARLIMAEVGLGGLVKFLGFNIGPPPT